MTAGSAASAALLGWHRRWLRALDECIALSVRDGAAPARAPAVSAWSVAQQLEHLLRADTSVLDTIDRLTSNDEANQTVHGGGPTLLGRFVLVTGFIPRGRAQAPESTTPRGLASDVLSMDLQALRERAAALGPSLAALEAVRATSGHPILGRFTPRTWIRFCGVHHAHHAKIIRDILRAASLR